MCQLIFWGLTIALAVSGWAIESTTESNEIFPPSSYHASFHLGIEAIQTKYLESTDLYGSFDIYMQQLTQTCDYLKEWFQEDKQFLQKNLNARSTVESYLQTKKPIPPAIKHLEWIDTDLPLPSTLTNLVKRYNDLKVKSIASFWEITLYSEACSEKGNTCHSYFYQELLVYLNSAREEGKKLKDFSPRSVAEGFRRVVEKRLMALLALLPKSQHQESETSSV